MITLSKIGADKVYVQWEPRYSADLPPLTYMDYNPVMSTRSRVRTLKYELTGTMNQLSDLFTKYPDAKIVNTLANEPYIHPLETELIHAQLKTISDVAAWKRVKINGVEVIDEFGMHLYIRSELDFTGEGKDIDLRY